MTLTKPKTEPPTTYLTARTKDGKGSKTLTLYGATPEQAIADYKKFVEERERRKAAAARPKRTAVPA